jgi:hypothetical protein
MRSFLLPTGQTRQTQRALNGGLSPTATGARKRRKWRQYHHRRGRLSKRRTIETGLEMKNKFAERGRLRRAAVRALSGPASSSRDDMTALKNQRVKFFGPHAARAYARKRP